MKKLATLFLLLFLPIMTGCKTTEIRTVYVLPPRPQRQELTTPESLKDYAQILNYYEHLVQQWEQWGDTVTLMVEKDNKGN